MKKHTEINKHGRFNRDKPTVSIVTPTYNRRKFIPFLINCVKKQTYPMELMEWVIVDDGEDCVEDLFKDDAPLELPTIKGLDAYIPQEDFFDTKLLERVDQASPTPTKNLESPKKIKNKAARKLPKKFLNKPEKLTKPKKKN